MTTTTTTTMMMMMMILLLTWLVSRVGIANSLRLGFSTVRPTVHEHRRQKQINGTAGYLMKLHILEFLRRETLFALETLYTRRAGRQRSHLYIHSVDGSFNVMLFQRAVIFSSWVRSRLINSYLGQITEKRNRWRIETIHCDQSDREKRSQISVS